MAWAPPALAAASLCLRISTDLVKATMAALLVGAVLSNAEHPHFPSSLRLEFPCVPSSELPAADILAFARGLQSDPGQLSSAQLSCLARLLAAKNLTADFGSFPPDLLLFFDPSEVRAGSCREFYSRASRGNLELLPRGSSQRMRLLRGALTCLGVQDSRLEQQQLGSLGALLCDLEPGSIATSGSAVLESLKLCPELTEPQRDALNALLLTAATEYGDPSSWDLQTLQDLGPLVLALNQTTLSVVAEAAREDFKRSIAAAYSSQDRSQREKSLLLLRALAAASASSHPRLKRSTEGCQPGPITASSINDSFLIFDYTPEQFDLCLSNDVMIENLKDLLDQPFPAKYFQVLKERVAQIFPLGIPEEELKCLWSLGELYTEQEKSQWPVTSSDTLSALLSPSGGQCDKKSPVQQLLGSYQVLGQFLTGPLLQQMGGEYLCKLQEEQIQQIPAEAIEAAGQLNISSCSQSNKDELYRKAREAFIRSYYCQIRPYLDGAPAEDLKNLANAGGAINMDLDTFLTLNPEELQKLSVTDVKNLLGTNLPELKKAENETLVRSWVERQSQRELDSVLGIGLQGGLQEPTTTATPASPTTSARATPTATVPTTATSATPVPSTVPTSVAITSPSTPQSSPVPPRTPTLSTLSPTPPASTTPHTGDPSVPTATPSVPTATPTVPTATPTVPTATPTVPTATPTVPTATPTVPTATPTVPTATPTVPTATPTARPTLSTLVPCSTHPPATTSRATSPAVTLLTTLLATSSPSAPSPSSSPVPAVTSRATTSTGAGINPAGTTHSTATTVPNATSTPTATPNTATTVPNATSAPIATTVPNVTSAPIATTVPNPSSAPTATHSTVPSVPNATNSTPAPAATTAPHTTSPPHKPTPIPNSTSPTQNSPSSSSAHPTSQPCHTSSPPAFPGPSPTPSSRETPRATPGKVPVPPPPTSHGYINLQPEAGSGSRLSSCLLPLLAATAGNILLRGLL